MIFFCYDLRNFVEFFDHTINNFFNNQIDDQISRARIVTLRVTSSHQINFPSSDI